MKRTTAHRMIALCKIRPGGCWRLILAGLGGGEQVECCCRRFHSGVEREGGAGGIVWQGRCDKYNFRSKPAGENMIMFDSCFEPRRGCRLCVFRFLSFRRPVERLPICDSRRPSRSPGRSNKCVPRQPQAVRRLSISNWPLYRPFYSPLLGPIRTICIS